MRRVLEEIRVLLEADPAWTRRDARTRFARLGASSLDLDVFAYVRAATLPEFLAVQEDLLLRILEIVEDAGTSVAFPSQTVYVRRTPSAAAASEDPSAAIAPRPVPWRPRSTPRPRTPTRDGGRDDAGRDPGPSEPGPPAAFSAPPGRRGGDREQREPRHGAESGRHAGGEDVSGLTG
jgi:hypothetical protein